VEEHDQNAGSVPPLSRRTGAPPTLKFVPALLATDRRKDYFQFKAFCVRNRLARMEHSGHEFGGGDAAANQLHDIDTERARDFTSSKNVRSVNGRRKLKPSLSGSSKLTSSAATQFIAPSHPGSTQPGRPLWMREEFTARNHPKATQPGHPTWLTSQLGWLSTFE